MAQLRPSVSIDHSRFWCSSAQPYTAPGGRKVSAMVDFNDSDFSIWDFRLSDRDVAKITFSIREIALK